MNKVDWSCGWDRWRGGYIRVISSAMWIETYWVGISLWKPSLKPGALSTLRIGDYRATLYLKRGEYGLYPRIGFVKLTEGWRAYS